jgi:MFS family permease
VRDPRLIGPEPVSEKISDDIVAAFESSKRRLLIVGEPGSGKTIAAYSLIEYLDESESDEGRIPLLVNLSAWEAQENLEDFLVDYLCSSVGYEVRERTVASAFIDSDNYSLILDGLDEIPAGFRERFSELLDEFVRGIPGEVSVVVTCRTPEYEELLAAYPTGLGLVQAVEILPLSSQQLDGAFVELAKRDKDWETFLSHRDHTAYKRVRDLLSNPLFLNLTVVGHLSPGQLLDWTTTEQELRDLVLDGYLDRTLADQRHYEAENARRYLSWIARFLSGDEVSPLGLKTTDYTVFDLADLTPPEPPRRYRLFGVLLFGLTFGLSTLVALSQMSGLFSSWYHTYLEADASERASVLLGFLLLALALGSAFMLVSGLGFGLTWGPFKRSAVSSRLILVWPSTRRQLLDFLRRARRGMIWGLTFGLIVGLIFGLVMGLLGVLVSGYPVSGLGVDLLGGLLLGLLLGLPLGLLLGLGFGLLETRSVLITSRTPKEARSRSVIAALTLLLSGVLSGLVGAMIALPDGTFLALGLVFGLAVGLVIALRNGGWFLLLQKIAHHRLARAGNLPAPPYEFLEWGVEQQIFRRVGGGVRFRHNLIQQHLANTQANSGG